MLEVNNLVKKYGKFLAVDGLSFTVTKGQIFGFVGPNGAGKTTTMRIISTLLAPTSGTVKVNGYDILKQQSKVRQSIGYMPDFFGVYDNLKVTEYMDFYASAYGINYRQRKKSADQLLELVNLSHKKDSYVDDLSRGMKQRLCLARCLIHNPQFLILDEPASGLDPRARIEVKGILKELKNMDKTVLISSHILPELAEICDVVGIIKNGKMAVQGSMEEITMKMTQKLIVNIKVLDSCEKAVNILKEQPFISGIKTEGNDIHIGYKGQDNELCKLLKTLVNNEVSIISFSKADGDLEKIFMEVTDDEEKAQ